MFAESLPAFLVGVLLQSITWGTFLAYCHSLCCRHLPCALEPVLGGFSIVMLIAGQFIASGLLVAFLGRG
jgi:hypothetical protein